MPMTATPLPIEGAYAIDVDPFEDSRGAFWRIFCSDEFTDLGLWADVAQASISSNPRVGTLRGLHWQAEPHAEPKLVRAVAGRAIDVLVDVRLDSPTFGVVVLEELSRENRRSLAIPPGVAHGFQTLEPETDLLYHMPISYAPESQRGIRFDDPELAIPWPIADPIVSERDRALPLFESVHTMAE